MHEGGQDDQRQVVWVQLLADSGPPFELARWLEGTLPRRLKQELGNEVDWRVRARLEPLPLNERGEIPMGELAERHRTYDREAVVLLTDLPRRAGTQPIASDFSTTDNVGLVSVPALGLVRLRRRCLNLVAHVLGHLVDDALGQNPQGGRRSATRPRAGRFGGLLAPFTHIPSDHEKIDMHLGLVGARGRLRLLAGMVRGNRPWRLVPNLASATAAAAGTSAYGLVTTSFWQMAHSLSPTRLAVITVCALTAMTAWLLTYNHLWDRPDEPGDREKAVLYNLATALTVLLGVATMYVLLFAVTLIAAAVLIDSHYFAKQLGQSITIADYANLVWLTSSVGIVAGALGSSLESEESVRRATYSGRERERQTRAREGSNPEQRSASP
jgi:hypothetical protein